MSDSVRSIDQVNSVPNYHKSKHILLYLVVVQSLSGDKNKIERYFATKVDKSESFIDFNGCLIDSLDNSENLLDFSKSLPKEKFENFLVPWQRVISIKNLIYKHKES